MDIQSLAIVLQEKIEKIFDYVRPKLITTNKKQYFVILENYKIIESKLF